MVFYHSGGKVTDIAWKIAFKIPVSSLSLVSHGTKTTNALPRPQFPYSQQGGEGSGQVSLKDKSLMLTHVLTGRGRVKVTRRKRRFGSLQRGAANTRSCIWTLSSLDAHPQLSQDCFSLRKGEQLERQHPGGKPTRRLVPITFPLA